VTDGSIEFMGEKIHHLYAEEIAKRGIFQIIEGRRVFEHLDRGRKSACRGPPQRKWFGR